jgi:hypothetical protein
MPLDWMREEASGEIIIPDIEVTRLALPRIPVWIGTALVGSVEAYGERLHLDLLKSLSDSGRSFTLTEILNSQNQLEAIELHFI